MTVPSEFGYARAADGAYIAYRTIGAGPIDLVWQFDFLGNVDTVLESGFFAIQFSSFASFTRVILHDRRATGLSSRNVAVPNLETRVSDLVAVLEAVDARRPVLGGQRDGGAPNALLAATDPGRIRSLIWYEPSLRSTWAPDYPWGVGPEYVDRESEDIVLWGTTAYGRAFIETEAVGGHDIDPRFAEMVARLSRHTATPDVARELTRVWYETDIRAVLPSIQVPSLLLAYEGSSIEDELDYAAGLMPDVQTRILAGSESDNDLSEFIEEIRGFLGVDTAPSMDTVLTTVLFTDIVDSTLTQARLGDRAWKGLIEQHHAIVRGMLERFRGQEQDTAGDGFYARFDGPARAIACAKAITEAVRPLGIEVRGGLHTGECEISDGKCTGLSVSIGARVMAQAGPGEVLVSQTVKDLVAGSGLTFDDAGEHELKGIPDRWRLYRVAS
ncbi:MAG: adenylate/guanylate cyclase domain-containing protein [Actinomycetota bacterium]